MAWECMEGVVCGKCGEKGHLQRNCKHISCHKCGRKGHIARFCNDPFAKAAEVERHERQQALASARAPILSFSDIGDAFETRETETTVLHRDIRGPWDGLGVNQQDIVSVEREQVDRAIPICSAGSHVETRKRLAPTTSVQGVVSQRLKIVGVKSDNETQKLSSTSMELLKTVEGSTSRWEGLVGYESEDSDEDRPGGSPG